PAAGSSRLPTCGLAWRPIPSRLLASRNPGRRSPWIGLGSTHCVLLAWSFVVTPHAGFECQHIPSIAHGRAHSSLTCEEPAVVGDRSMVLPSPRCCALCPPRPRLSC